MTPTEEIEQWIAKHGNARDALNVALARIHSLETALKFYANQNHWMSITENSDRSNLVAHGSHFNGTSDGWIEAEVALHQKREIP